MKIKDTLEIAISTFLTNKMRTILTVVSVSVGIGAIVFLVSLGYGVQELTIKRITALKALTTFDLTTGDSTLVKLDNALLDKLAQIEGTEEASPNLTVSGQMTFANTTTDVTVNLVQPSFFDLEGLRLKNGAYFQEKENEAVISAATAQALGADEKIIGQEADLTLFLPQVTTTDFKKEAKKYRVSGISQEDLSLAYLPLSSVVIEEPQYSLIKLKVKNAELMEKVRGQVEEMGLKAISLGDTVAQMNRIFHIVQIVLLVLGGIALLVAAIGMFNTMTISLLERTRDIGIMKSLGARNNDIYRIFLAEALIMGAAGGLLGLTLGWLLGFLINSGVNLLAHSVGAAGFRLFVVPWWFALGIVGFSFVVGILTGFYPARRAARLNPLHALRFE